MSSKRNHRIVFLVFTGLLLIIALACSVSFGQKDDSAIENLQLQLTVQALQAQAAQSDQNQPAQPVESQSNQVQSEDHAAPAPTVTPTEDTIPCNDSHIIGETIKDGTVYEPGETFQKTWTLRNEGDCDWTTGYTLKFIEGSRMGGESSVNVPSVIEPNEDITFLVNLKAPDAEGDYTGVWQLFADDGEEMGRYWVKITVKNPTPPLAVTSVSTNITNKTFSGACPQAISVEVYIKVNAAGTITYQPETSDLGMAPIDTIKFDSAGSDTEFYTWTIQSSGNYWLKVHIPDPNHQTFGPFNMTVNCQ
jgi:hypothetical protein